MGISQEYGNGMVNNGYINWEDNRNIYIDGKQWKYNGRWDDIMET